MRAKYVISILCAFIIIISSASAYASWQLHKENNIKADSVLKIKENAMTVLNPEKGIFKAELGMKTKEPFIYLKGNYLMKNKYYVCNGNAIIKDKEGKFSGIFKGEYFELKIIVEEKPFIISGKYKLDENKENFKGSWIWKDEKKEIGWITGTFNKKDPDSKTFLGEGIFNAELGRRGSFEPFVLLNGNYHTRIRFILVKGNARAGEKMGRFRGIFFENHFIIQTFTGRGNILIFGRCVYDETHTHITGVWIGRGIPIRGWITGTFTR